MKVEPASSPQQSPADDDLFHDMTPVFQKPKKVRTHCVLTNILYKHNNNNNNNNK